MLPNDVWPPTSALRPTEKGRGATPPGNDLIHYGLWMRQSVGVNTRGVDHVPLSRVVVGDECDPLPVVRPHRHRLSTRHVKSASHSTSNGDENQVKTTDGGDAESDILPSGDHDGMISDVPTRGRCQSCATSVRRRLSEPSAAIVTITELQCVSRYQNWAISFSGSVQPVAEILLA
jgi:hypothetical protein